MILNNLINKLFRKQECSSQPEQYEMIPEELPNGFIQDIVVNNMDKIKTAELSHLKMRWESRCGHIFYGGWNGVYHEWWLSIFSIEDVCKFNEYLWYVDKFEEWFVDKMDYYGKEETLQLEDTYYYQLTFNFNFKNTFRNCSFYFVSTKKEYVMNLFDLLNKYCLHFSVFDEVKGEDVYLKRFEKEKDKTKNLFEF